tara:strand:+ start:1487 stop:2074 length:588 start_codon:yes stop_codon:yes gene_type:complete
MDDVFREKLNLDELFTQNKTESNNKIVVYQKILQRVHNKIKLTSRQRNNMKCCWYVIPEFILGLPKYDTGSCTGYLMNKLDENGFIVKYTYPNLLFISWNHYIPDYERMAIKKEQGISIDGFGNIIKKKKKNEDDGNFNNLMLKNAPESSSDKKGILKKPKDDKYKSINTYKPKGLIYSNDLINSINNVMNDKDS